MKNIDKKELHSIFTNLRIDKEKSFNELYEKYSKLIYNIAFSILKSRENSEDVMQFVSVIIKEHYSYGEWYRIDKFEVDGWQELEPITDDYAFTDIAWLIGEDNTLEDKVDWFDLYGELEDGRYRLVKRIYDGGAYKYFSTDFYLGDDTEIIN